MGKAADRAARCIEANNILTIISQHGRRFFSDLSDHPNRTEREPERISRFELDDRGRLWFIDKYRSDRVYTADSRDGFGRKFTEGGTLRGLCQELAKYIRTGYQIPAGHFGPWPDWYSNRDPWAYGDSMATVRQLLTTSPAIAEPRVLKLRVPD